MCKAYKSSIWCVYTCPAVSRLCVHECEGVRCDTSDFLMCSIFPHVFSLKALEQKTTMTPSTKASHFIPKCQISCGWNIATRCLNLSWCKISFDLPPPIPPEAGIPWNMVTRTSSSAPLDNSYRNVIISRGNCCVSALPVLMISKPKSHLSELRVCLTQG